MVSEDVQRGARCTNHTPWTVADPGILESQFEAGECSGLSLWQQRSRREPIVYTNFVQRYIGFSDLQSPQDLKESACEVVSTLVYAYHDRLLLQSHRTNMHAIALGVT